MGGTAGRLCPIAAALLLLAAAPRSARAQMPEIYGPPRLLWALDLDGGLTRELGSGGASSRWRAFGRVGAGIARFDGLRLQSATLELGGHRSSRRTLGLAAQIASVQMGLSTTATLMRDLTHGGFGAGLGAGFSFLQLQGQLFQNGPATRAVSLFLRVPVGLLFHVWRTRAR